MPKDHHRHMHRRRVARIMLFLVFCALTAAELLLWYFTTHRVNPWPFLQGHVVGSALVTTVLLVALWQRNFWARYILIVILWYLVAVFGIVVLVIAGEEFRVDLAPVSAAVGALLLYISSNILLIRSRRIQQLAQPPGSGG